MFFSMEFEWTQLTRNAKKPIPNCCSLVIKAIQKEEKKGLVSSNRDRLESSGLDTDSSSSREFETDQSEHLWGRRDSFRPNPKWQRLYGPNEGENMK